MGKSDAAIGRLEVLLKAGEQVEHVLWPLAEIYASQGKLDKAIFYFEEYLSDYPDKPVVEYNLAYLLRKNRQFDNAILHYRRALGLNIDQPEEVYVNIGVIFSDDLRQENRAREAFENALKLNSVYIPALFNLANLNEQEGRLEEARKMFGRILDLDPEYYDALARLGELGNFTDPKDAVIQRMKKAADHGRMEVSTRINLYYALGAALDQCGDYGHAFENYRWANNLDQRTLPPYEPRKMEKYVDEIVTIFSAEWFSSLPKISDAAPVFICGMFRSGSTLVEQILASHSRVTAGGEIEYFLKKIHMELKPFPQSVTELNEMLLAEMAAEYLALLNKAYPGYEVITDKRPDNIFAIGLIKTLFPKARLIFTGRNSLDNCLSVYFMRLGPLMNYATDIGNIAHYYRQCERLCGHWKSIFPDTVHEVNYDELVVNPEPVIRNVVKFCDLPWEEKCLAFHKLDNVVKTGSVLQVRQPLYKSSSGRWRNYEPYLNSLLDIFQK